MFCISVYLWFPTELGIGARFKELLCMFERETVQKYSRKENSRIKQSMEQTMWQVMHR